MSAPKEKAGGRRRILIRGAVQGVGFRPFLHRLARELSLRGWARNTPEGLEAEVEGAPEAVRQFVETIADSPPPLARVDRVQSLPLRGPGGWSDFSIRESQSASEAPGTESPALVSPDIALCPHCLRELKTPGDRRFRYPFINCTSCGPRYTILRALPYDRANTVMDRFPMCPDCLAEYWDIENRRYHAQPDCCPDCGPACFYLDGDGQPLPGDPFSLAQQALFQGKIVAVKGIGGIHLACDASDKAAVERLRQRKNRPEKPLALLCASLAEAEKICRISPEEKAVLCGRERPILLLEKRERASFPWIAAGARLGILLPYSPVHELLADGAFGGPRILIMTSANRPGCPVLTDNEEALRDLSGIADGFLLHNRPILNRCDDSLAALWKDRLYFTRRSRGYAPLPLELPESLAEEADGICAFGAEQKASFALGRGSRLFLSPHIGDLKNLETLEHYRQAFDTFRDLFSIRPSRLVCDLHPDYFSTALARSLGQERKLPLLAVQHHWAHMAACMADNGLTGPVFGIVWDGTGLGEDGDIWGGEFLRGDYTGYTRLGSIRPILLPGGDRAAEEIGRAALSLLLDAGCDPSLAPLSPEKQTLLQRLLTAGETAKSNAPSALCPRASSIGRLFDGVFSLIAGISQVSGDGEAPRRLEALSPWETPEEIPAAEMSKTGLSPYPLAFYEDRGLRRFDTRPLIRALAADRAAGTPAAFMALGFMDCLCRMALDQTRALNPERLPVVLSGGVFLNRFLLAGISARLEAAGYTVYCHRNVSPGDQGLCLGQAAIAAGRRTEKQARELP